MMKTTSPRNNWSKHSTFLETVLSSQLLIWREEGGLISRAIEAYESVAMFDGSFWVKGRNYIITLEDLETNTYVSLD